MGNRTLLVAILGLLMIGLSWLVAFNVLATDPPLVEGETNNVSISYVPPKNPELVKVYELLKERRVLERLQVFISPFRLPRELQISLSGCDGEADAFYGDAEITICYEYIVDLWKKMPAKRTNAGIEPVDTVVGPFIDTSLHEFAHALFDMLNIPLLGREEDAADQVAAYIYLHLGPEESRRLIMGTAYAYITEELGSEKPRKLNDFASEHGTPAQRAFNVLCIAYGADSKLFGDFVTKGYLPKTRAEICEEEYEQVQDAFDALISPHIDEDLAEKLLSRSWLQKSKELTQ